MERLRISTVTLCALFLLCGMSTAEIYAYPGKIDVRVVAGAESLRGQARDLEQTLLATVYSLGGRITVRGQAGAEDVADRARKALGEIDASIHAHLKPSEARDLRLAVETVEYHFRDDPGRVSLDQWVVLVRVQATLLALSGYTEQAMERFSFFFNLQPQSGPEVVKEALTEVRSTAVKAHAKWRRSPKASLLIKGLSNESRVFVNGLPVVTKNGRLTGLRLGLHLVQVFAKDAPPFGAVVKVTEKGLATVVVRNREIAGADLVKAVETKIFNALSANQELPDQLLRGLPGKLGVDGVLFVSVDRGEKKASVVRGVWVHSTHSARYLSLTLAPGVSFRSSLDQKVRALLTPLPTP